MRKRFSYDYIEKRITSPLKMQLISFVEVETFFPTISRMMRERERENFSALFFEQGSLIRAHKDLPPSNL